MPWLLDVNALIALLDPDHLQHDTMHRWFERNHQATWATCPLVENGLVRVLSQPAYPGGAFPPQETLTLLRDWKANYAATHEFWTENVSLTDEQLFRPEFITAHGQISDVYLLGLAFSRSARLVTFDRRLAWNAIRGADASLIVTP